MTKKYVSFPVLIFALFAAWPIRGEESCPQLNGSDARVLVAYLGRDRTTLEPTCVRAAIDRLGNARHSASASVLVEYLDYRLDEKPDPDADPYRGYFRWIGTDYPAARALFIIGRPAVPALIFYLAGTVSSDQARAIAIQLIERAYGEYQPEGVITVVRAAREIAKTDAVAGMRLQKVAEQMARNCTPSASSDCQLALYR